ncbi:hypothetical protein KGF54_004425 [Candida jiufengensis]|uniref:uncharacterized protein n=1 Tax=Candida jiufengensis TaxID=497108 RepID=UPI0022246EF3|nr:uncharacterized protein KGF54_004425 [Candida jiufengensis]KAI5951351.1 hypothetical protein KGF54_004425 [Candida jiufengensis]
MAGLFDLEHHLIFYRSYHFNSTNVAIHLVCIPIILFTAISFLSLINFPSISSNDYFNFGNIVAWIYGLYYIALDWKLGIPSASILISFGYFIKRVYLSLDSVDQDNFLKFTIGLHILSWIAQFYDNLLGAIVLAPFFTVFEFAFYSGFRLDVKRKMDNEAAKNIRDFKAREKAKKAGVKAN